MKSYIRHRIRNVVDIKELIALEVLDFEGKYQNYVETHDFWELCFVIHGKIALVLEEETISLSHHQLILVPPNKKHAYRSEKGNENRVFVVCFDSFSQMLNAIREKVFSVDSLQMDCMEKIMEECAATFRMNESDQLEVLPSPQFGGQQALLLLLEYLLIGLVRKMSVDKNSDIVFFSDENFHADLAKTVLRYLRENIQKKITLADICSKFSYSRSFLCKTFKEQTGQTLIAYVNRLKMEEAERLLKETALSVTEIACHLSFSEVKYFDATFKKHTGLTPVAYRRRAVDDKTN